MGNKIPFTVLLIHIHTDFLKTMKPFEMVPFSPGVQLAGSQILCKCYCIRPKMGHLSLCSANEINDLTHSKGHVSGQAHSLTKGTKEKDK